MTQDEYLERCKGPHERLAILRGQVALHLNNASATISLDVLEPLFQNMADITDELVAIDRAFWAPRKPSPPAANPTTI